MSNTDNRTQHTPTPYQYQRYTDGGVSILHSVKSDSALTLADMVHTGTHERDAAFIVRACNSHDALVAALRESTERLHAIRPLVAKSAHAAAMTMLGHRSPLEAIDAQLEDNRAALKLAEEG